MFPFLVLRAVPIAKWILPAVAVTIVTFVLGLKSPLSFYHSTPGKFCLLMKPADKRRRRGVLVCQVLEVFKPCFSMMFHSLRRLD